MFLHVAQAGRVLQSQRRGLCRMRIYNSLFHGLQNQTVRVLFDIFSQAIANSIQRYLNEKNYKGTILSDPKFRLTKMSIEAKKKKLKSLGYGNTKASGNNKNVLLILQTFLI